MKSEITTTHSCLRFLLVFAQCFGMLPVIGITKQCSELKFQWNSKRTFYSLLFAIVAAVNTAFFFMNMIRGGTQKFTDWVTLAFYLVTFITVLMFIDVAKKWPLLLKKWSEVDSTMFCYGFPSGLQKKVKILTITILGAAIVEHSLFIVVAVASSECENTLKDCVDHFFQYRFDYVFTVIKYHILLGIFLQVLNIFSTVSWNFMDLFIIVVSLCLSARFKQVAKTISHFALKKVKNEPLWEKVRQDYTRLSVLSATVDHVMSTLVLVSFGNNLFVILVQLFNTLESPPRYGILDKTYYIYSFGFLIIRITAVALYASTVNTESMKPKFHLNTLPHLVYNVEIERLLYQTKYNSPALTGHKLFRVTRPLILKITVAIVSYELVLVEFLKFNSK